MAIECQNHIQPRTKGPTQAYASGVMGALFIEREKLAAILALQLASSAPVFLHMEAQSYRDQTRRFEDSSTKAIQLQN